MLPRQCGHLHVDYDYSLISDYFIAELINVNPFIWVRVYWQRSETDKNEAFKKQQQTGICYQ